MRVHNLYDRLGGVQERVYKPEMESLWRALPRPRPLTEAVIKTDYVIYHFYLNSLLSTLFVNWNNLKNNEIL